MTSDPVRKDAAIAEIELGLCGSELQTWAPEPDGREHPQVAVTVGPAAQREVPLPLRCCR